MSDLAMILWVLSVVPLAWASSRAAHARSRWVRWVKLLLYLLSAWFGAFLMVAPLIATTGPPVPFGVGSSMVALGLAFCLPLALALWRVSPSAAFVEKARSTEPATFWLDRPNVKAAMQRMREHLARDAESARRRAVATHAASRSPRAGLRNVRSAAAGGYLFDYAKPGEPSQRRHATFTSYSMYEGSLYLNGDDHDRYGEERSFKASRVRGKFIDADTGEMVSLRMVKRDLQQTQPQFGHRDISY